MTSLALGEFGPSPARQRTGVTNRLRIAKYSRIFILELQNEFAAVLAPGVIEEAAKLRAPQVGLNVPRVEVIESVENSNAGPRLKMFVMEVNCERTGQLDIERREPWKPFDVSRSDVFAEFVLHR